ncbi:hypothetical protein OOU_Y34scaffold00657g8 [Pyricularia oryzae Y34]|uniref:Methyltransferase domain-containing protein n=1 Tax=Pyricularia oryzae (strain Y34) TaxID=1143189 RepID=A0AA97PJ43_PYRO3|nr:hypothetical protein OOU_Y34scaffold00657g8 [Pyricularia oryzae Y34]
MDSNKLIFTGLGTLLCLGIGLSRLLNKQGPKTGDQSPGLLQAFGLFFYTCFVKPHRVGGTNTQQDALESFYETQASIYDVTRTTLLKGREDMLALAAAQLLHRAKKQSHQKRIWVDIGGGTGWNIEAMNRFVDVPEFFSSVYLVDFSPSLCEVARQRFQRLGWKNVRVVCQDARKFRIEDHEASGPKVIDSLSSLLAPGGIMGVVDFYAQSKVDFSFRNHTAGLTGRHCGFILRSFWRAWFDLDRVSLEPARRDYLEYRFGTVLGVNTRNRMLGNIPYYIWIGCSKTSSGQNGSTQSLHENVSPKAVQVAVKNSSAGLPLPSFFYQNHAWRIYYDDQLRKHKQFNDEYIYAFTWEDTRVDARLLKISSDDVVLAITSAGDNILSYISQSPARVHAVDLNPSQNHLLELKLASYSALDYADFWKIFGEGHHDEFRALLINKLSPHLSSRAFQYWFANAHIFTSKHGLYDTGGSKHAIRAFRWISSAFGVRSAVREMLEAKTLNEQREIWQGRIRPALLSRMVSNFVVSQEQFLWSALGVPKHQLAMLERDHATSKVVSRGEASNSRTSAIWQFMSDTLDPVAHDTHIAEENPYYYVTMAGKFSPRCHPDYLSPAAHAKLSRRGALEDRIRIHTEEIDVVLAGLAPGSLTVAVVMDSMDWFDPKEPGVAAAQISKLNRALKPGGRVLLRSAGLKPWYVEEFAKLGFAPKRVGCRSPETRCIDRVNMYASCWLLTKTGGLPPPTPGMEGEALFVIVNVTTTDSRNLVEKQNVLSKPGAQQTGLIFNLCQSENIHADGKAMRMSIYASKDV